MTCAAHELLRGYVFETLSQTQGGNCAERGFMLKMTRCLHPVDRLLILTCKSNWARCWHLRRARIRQRCSYPCIVRDVATVVQLIIRSARSLGESMVDCHVICSTAPILPVEVIESEKFGCFVKIQWNCLQTVCDHVCSEQCYTHHK